MTRPTCQGDVALFVPNIIGYARIILAFISFYFMPTNYVIAVIAYILSVFLDSLDGYFARALDQCSKLGAIMDQLTDRCTTMGLLVTLSQFYSKFMFLFQLYMVIDIACHWIHLHGSNLQGFFLLAIITFPFMIMKTYISVLQGFEAYRIIVSIDVQDRNAKL